MQNPLPNDTLHQLAHRRAKAKMGWLIHAFVYLVVNAALLTVHAAGLRHGSVLPALGWGLGLMIHGLVVWWAGPGSALRQSLVQSELRKLQTQRDPW